jgi:hypothetical protein
VCRRGAACSVPSVTLGFKREGGQIVADQGVCIFARERGHRFDSFDTFTAAGTACPAPQAELASVA